MAEGIEEQVNGLLVSLASEKEQGRRAALSRVLPEHLKEDHILTAVRAIAEHDPVIDLRRLAREALETADKSPAPDITEAPGEVEILSILQGLASQESERRYQAIQSAARLTYDDARVQTALQGLAAGGSDAARDALRHVWADTSASVESTTKPDGKSIWTSSEFWLGFIGFYVLNGIAFAVIYSVAAVAYQYPAGGLNNLSLVNILTILLCVANIVEPIVLAVLGRKDAILGLLAAWAAALALAVCAGILLAATCGSLGSI